MTFKRSTFHQAMADMQYFIMLLVTTPRCGLIIVLQVFSGFASLLGLPLLIPVLELMQGTALSEQSSGYLLYIQPFFRAFGIQVDFVSMLGLAAVLILGGQLLVNASSLLTAFVKEDLLKSYRDQIFKAYFSANWQWLTDHHSGRLYHAAVREAEQACDAHMNAQRVFINLFQIAIFFLISIRLSWQISVLAVMVYVILGVFNALNLRKINVLSVKVNEKSKEFSNEVVGFQHNKKFIKVALLDDVFSKALAGMIGQICSLKKKQFIHWEMQRAWSMMSTSILLIVLIGSHKTFGLGYATLLLVLFVFLRIAPQIVALSDILTMLEMNIPMHKSLREHLKALSLNQERNGDEPFLPGTVFRFEQVGFAYPKQQQLLKGLDLLIVPHTVTALVGASGCGKSTILDLVAGLLEPTSGLIFYGNVTHVNLDKNSLRKHMAFVGQRPSLLSGTLRENIIVSRPMADDGEVRDICCRVHLKELIDQLPKGLETVVGENGIKLSGGQRQKIALARCLLTRPKILILDEATSELDLESEGVIQKTLEELKPLMTTIVVAHRLSTIKGADRIYVIDDGVACESGTYEQLMADKGRLYALASAQN